MDRRLLALAGLIGLFAPSPATAQIGNLQTFNPPTLGVAVRDSETVAVCRMDQENEDRPRIIRFEMTEILKGNERLAAPPRSSLRLYCWARPANLARDRQAIIFINGDTALVYYDQSWHDFCFDSREEYWNTNLGSRHGFLYAGSAPQLAEAVRTIAAGGEVVIPAVKSQAAGRGGFQMDAIWRIKAGLAIDVKPRTIRSPSFVGWGAGEPAELPRMIARLKDPSERVRSTAIRDILSLGSASAPALPALWDRLADRDGNVRLLAATALLQMDPSDNLPLLAILFELERGDDDSRRMAGYCLCWLGSRALPTLPRLLSCFEKENSLPNCSVLDTLARVAGHADESTQRRVVAAIAAKLRQAREREERFEALCLPPLRIAARLSEPAFSTIDLLTGQWMQVGANQLGVRTPYLRLPWLDLVLQSRSRQVDLIQALKTFGSDALAVVPELRHLLKHRCEDVRCQAASALLKIDASGEAGRVGPVLRQIWMTGRNHESNRLASSMLQAYRSYWRAPIPEPTALDRRLERNRLMKVIRNDDSGERYRALDRLQTHGREARDKLPELWQLMKSDKTTFKAVLITALWTIDQPMESETLRNDPRPALISQLREYFYSDKDERRSFLYAAAKIGAGAGRLVPEVRQCLDDPELRLQALIALRNIGRAAQTTIPDLVRLTDLDQPGAQEAAIVALCRVGQGHPHGVQRLREWCETESLDILLSIEPADLGTEKITPLLQRAMLSDNHTLAMHARKLLEATDPESALKVASR